jgi:hypothetical protein
VQQYEVAANRLVPDKDGIGYFRKSVAVARRLNSTMAPLVSLSSYSSSKRLIDEALAVD